MYNTFIHIALFLFYSFFGYILEVTYVFLKTKKIVNRGFLIGPIVPIYGYGGLLIEIFLTRFKSNIALLFIVAILLAGVLEYLTSYIMEKLFKTRWWDYSSEKYNLKGRICLKNLLLFGLLAIITVKLINPFIIELLESIDIGVLKVFTSIFIILYIIDTFISTIIIYSIQKDSKLLSKDSTEEINKKVKETLLNKGLFKRRIAKAFPNFRYKG